MNFFEHQEHARRQTRRLIAYYGIAVLLIILSLYGVTALIFHYEQTVIPNAPFNWPGLWDPNLFGIVALATAALILSGSVYKIRSLSSGGEAVARMLGGRPIAPNTTQFQEKRLLNVVEEMAIASGTPIPRVFILDQEQGINAFAAGFAPADAIIGVTRGTLEKLNREELQGVIGHEFSHILNGDMRLNIRLIGVLNGILVIALTGYWMFRIVARSNSGGSSRSKKGNPLLIVLLLGLAMMMIGFIGVFFARLIKSAVSRQREFLADASSVQFTRNSTGLAGALKKILGLTTGSRVQSESAESVSHLFFANGLSSPFLGLLATHPPLEERIRLLDPQFVLEESQSIASPESEIETGPRALAPPPFPDRIMAQAGSLSAVTLAGNTHLLVGLSSGIEDAARTPNKAQAVVFSLLLDPREALRKQQLADLATRIPADLKLETETLFALMADTSRDTRAVLANLATSSLKNMAPDQYPAFRKTVMALVAADSEISLFEYMILRLTLHSLDPQFGLGRIPKIRLTSLAPAAQETATVLSALAWFGTNNPPLAETAFRAGCREVDNLDIHLLPMKDSSLKDLDAALDRLTEATPLIKQKLVAACTAAVSADGLLTNDESEALRAVAATLDCPIPPLRGR
ncbi:MAG: M48 family metallopeptidase [bacterium]